VQERNIMANFPGEDDRRGTLVLPDFHQSMSAWITPAGEAKFVPPGRGGGVVVVPEGVSFGMIFQPQEPAILTENISIIG
jgi:hypothetical protein